MKSNMEEASQPARNININIALLPPPGFLGHLIPFIELAKQIVSHRNCTVTLIIPHDGSSMTAQKSLLHPLPAAINPIFLPPVSADDLREDDHPEIILLTRSIRSLPAVRDTLSSLRESGTPATALVVDHFASDAIDIAKEFGIPAYIFLVVAAYLLSLLMDTAASAPETQQVPKSLTLPGSIEVNAAEFPAWMRDSNVGVHKQLFKLSMNYNSPQGILVNSFPELEPAAFKEIYERHSSGPRVYPVGPLIRTSPETESECLKWLDDQPPESVLFVSFGSGAALSAGQIRELALGLEMSGQRFVWVVRTPQENAEAAYFSAQKSSPTEFLPQGFVERTRERGLVVASWAPQIRVLSHASTGGFLTHCGWNSIMEGVVFGVPFIAWPLCFEQKTTAAFLKEGLHAALRVRENEDGIVERGEIAEVVREVMEGGGGRQIRKIMAQLQIAAGNAMSEEGSSTMALAQLIQSWFN